MSARKIVADLKIDFFRDQATQGLKVGHALAATSEAARAFFATVGFWAPA